MKKIICWLLVIIWMVIIFIFSNMNSEVSSSNSRGITHTVISIIDNTFNLNLDIDKTVENVHGPIRKLAHFTIYFILSIFIVIALSNYDIKLKNKLLITLGICFIYACTDEFHQLFINGRSGEFRDVIIDSLGCSLNLIIYYFRKKKVS